MSLSRWRRPSGPARILVALTTIAVTSVTAITAGVMTSSPASAATAAYHYVNLGGGVAIGISQNGQYIAVQSSFGAAGGTLLSSSGVKQSTLPGNFEMSPVAPVNNAGTVGGALTGDLSSNDGPGPGAYVPLGGSAISLPTPTDSQDSNGVWVTASAIPNDNGNFTGTGDCAPGTNSNSSNGAVTCSSFEGYYFTSGNSSLTAIQPTGTDANGNADSEAFAINDSNVIVGEASENGTTQAFYSSAGGTPQVMGPKPAANTELPEPEAISNNNLVVGIGLLTGGGGDDAWSGKTTSSSYTDLGALPAPPMVADPEGGTCGGGAISDAYAVNTSGTIVGQSVTPDTASDPQGLQACGAYHAVVWAPSATTPTDLSAAGETDAPSNVLLTDATGIDANGDIVGDSVVGTAADHSTDAFILEPNAAPTVSSVVVTGSSGPATGPIAGGTAITITGTNFGPQGSSDQVDLVFGPTASPTDIVADDVMVSDSTTITAVTGDATSVLPTGQSSLATDVEVTTTSGTSAPNPPGDQFTYTNAVVVNSVDPPSASPWGGVPITIAGSGFDQPGTTPTVSFCLPAAPTNCSSTSGTADITSVTNTAITLLLPPFGGNAPPPDAQASDPPLSVILGGASYPVNVIVTLSPTGSAGTIQATSANPPPAPLFTYRVGVTSVVPSTTSPGMIRILGYGFGTGLGSGVAGAPNLGGGPDNIFFCIPGTNWVLTTTVSDIGDNDSCAEELDVTPLNDGEIDVTSPSGPIVVSLATDLGVGGTLLSGSFTADVYVNAEDNVGGPGTLQSTLSLQSVTPHSTGANPLEGTVLTLNGTGLGGADAWFCPSGDSPETVSFISGLTYNPACVQENPLTGSSATTLLVRPPTFVLGQNGGTFNSEDFDVYAEGAATAFTANVTGGYEPSAGYYPTWSNSISYNLQVTITGPVPTVLAPGGGTPVQVFGSGFGQQAAGYGNVPDQVFFCPAGVNPPNNGTAGCAQGTSEVTKSDEEIDVVAPPPPPDAADGVNLWVQVVGDVNISSYIPLQGKVIAWGLPQPVTYSAVAPPCGTLSNCNSATNSDPNSSAVATSTTPTGAITATGNGTGGITVGRYPADPVGAPAFDAAGSYFDVSVSNPNSFTSATIQDCDLAGGTTAQWWNPAANADAGAWQPVTPETLSAGPPPCLTITVNATSSPTLAQLTGTVFGIALPATGTTKADVDLDTHSRDVKPGDIVTLHASVSGRHHKPTPTGTMSFTDNGVAISSCTDLDLPASGKLTCTLSYASITGSPHHLVASYSGDPTYAPATATATIRVTKFSTRLRLDASEDRVTVGQQLTYRATILADHDKASPTPTGTVTFTDDGVAIPGCSSVALNSTGPTTCTVTATHGTQHIKAVYSGDNAYDGSSATLTEVIKPSGTT